MSACLVEKAYTGLICTERSNKLELAWNKNKVSLEAYETHGSSYANNLYSQIFL